MTTEPHWALALHVSVLLWARSAPLFLLTPYLAVGALPSLWGAALSWAYAGALTPLMLRACGAEAACAAALRHDLSWSAGAGELLVGSVIALGIGLPCLAFRTTGAIVQGLGGIPSPGTALGEGMSSKLGRAVGLTALVAAALADAWSGLSQLLLRLDPPLGAANFTAPTARALLRPLAEQLLQAFSLGVSLSAPLLLAVVLAAALIGLLGRVAGARLTPLGPALWPWLGVALVSLCVANWLDVLPGIVRSFAQSAARLLAGLP